MRPPVESGWLYSQAEVQVEIMAEACVSNGDTLVTTHHLDARCGYCQHSNSRDSAAFFFLVNIFFAANAFPNIEPGINYAGDMTALDDTPGSIALCSE